MHPGGFVLNQPQDYGQMLPWSAGPSSTHATIPEKDILNDNLAQSYNKTHLIPHTAAPKMQTATDSLQFEYPPYCLSCEKNKWQHFLIQSCDCGLLGKQTPSWQTLFHAKCVCVCVFYLCCWSCLCDAPSTSCACSWITSVKVYRYVTALPHYAHSGQIRSATWGDWWFTGTHKFVFFTFSPACLETMFAFPFTSVAEYPEYLVRECLKWWRCTVPCALLCAYRSKALQFV